MSDDRKWIRRTGREQLAAETEDGQSIYIDRFETHVTLSVAGESAIFSPVEYRQWLTAQARYMLGVELHQLEVVDVSDETPEKDPHEEVPNDGLPF